MTDPQETPRTYPYISTNVWAELRLRFQRSVPARVTPTYLQSALGFNTEKAARNLIPQLKATGIIDADGAPTDLARTFRIDSEYPAVADHIVRSVYPQELLDLFPGPEEDVTEVGAWFMRHTGGGQASASSQARFYLSLASKQIPSSKDKAAKVNRSDGPRAKSQPRVASPKTKPQPVDPTAASEVNEPAAPTASSSNRPNLHLDVQIHISAEASVDQIDAVFASMAKHLYG